VALRAPWCITLAAAGGRANRQLHSTQAREIMELFCQLNRAGTTIVQVTHSETNALYGSASWNCAMGG